MRGSYFLTCALLIFHQARSQQPATELLYSLRWDDGTGSIVRVAGDPDVYLPLLAAGTTLNTSTVDGAGSIGFKSIAVHHKYGMVAWGNPNNGRVEIAPEIYQGGESLAVLSDIMSDRVHGLSIDWLAHNLYVTDATFNRITVVSLKKFLPDEAFTLTREKVLLKGDMEEPWGIAAHPLKSYLFWTDKTKQTIERSSLSGEGRIKLYTTPGNPTSMVIDFNTIGTPVFWLDVTAGGVWTCGVDGSNPREIFKSTVGVFHGGLAAYGKWIFTTNSVTKNVHAYDISGQSVGNAVQFGISSGSATVVEMYDVTMYAQEQQPTVSSPCDSAPCSSNSLCVGADDNTRAECLCETGYKMDSATGTCVFLNEFRTPRYIYVTTGDVCILNNNAPHYTAAALQNAILNNCNEWGVNHRAVTFDVKRKFLYVMSASDQIVQIEMGESRRENVLITAEKTGNFRDMAVDWVSGNVFWTSNVDDEGQIQVVTSDSRHKAYVYRQLPELLALTTDPRSGRLYWSTEQTPHMIQYGPMSGAGSVQTLVSTDLVQPSQLTIDFVTNRLYWTDLQLGNVESIALDGTDRKVLYSLSSAAPYGLALFEDHIFWTDLATRELVWAYKHNGTEERRAETFYTLGAAISWDNYQQPADITNACENNGGCQHLCLPNDATTRVCSCGIGYELQADGVSCQSSPVYDNFFIVADRGLKTIIQIDNASGKLHAIDVVGVEVENPIAVDYDPDEGYIYWSDVSTNKINRCLLDGSGAETVRDLDVDAVVDGLVLDQTYKKLYYTETNEDVINQMDFGGTGHHQILSLVDSTRDPIHPRAIILDVPNNYMYYTDWGVPPIIERARLDGSERQTIVDTRISWPNGIALHGSTLCWCDAYLHSIECANTDGTNRVMVLQQTTDHFFSIVMDENYIYATSWSRDRLLRIDRNTGTFMEIHDKGLMRPSGMTYYSSGTETTALPTTTTPTPTTPTPTPTPTPSPSTTTTASTKRPPMTSSNPTSTTKKMSNLSPTSPTLKTTISTIEPVTTHAAPVGEISHGNGNKIGTTEIIAISVGIGGFVLIFAIVVTAIVCCYKIAQRKRVAQNQNRETDYLHTVLNAMPLPTYDQSQVVYETINQKTMMKTTTSFKDPHQDNNYEKTILPGVLGSPILSDRVDSPTDKSRGVANDAFFNSRPPTCHAPPVPRSGENYSPPPMYDDPDYMKPHSEDSGYTSYVHKPQPEGTKMYQRLGDVNYNQSVPPPVDEKDDIPYFN
jgi:hypothetical protein